jgi:integrase
LPLSAELSSRVRWEISHRSRLNSKLREPRVYGLQTTTPPVRKIYTVKITARARQKVNHFRTLDTVLFGPHILARLAIATIVSGHTKPMIMTMNIMTRPPQARPYVQAHKGTSMTNYLKFIFLKNRAISLGGDQVVRDYVDYGKATGSIGAGTAHRHEGIIRSKIAKSPFGSLPVSELTRQHIKNFYTKEHEINAPATVLKTHNLLSAALKEAIEGKLITDNVCAKKLRPSIDKEEVEPFTEDEMHTLLRYATGVNHRDGNLIHVAFRTGLRSGELLGLQWSDIDFKAARLTVNHTLVNYGKKPTLGKPKNDKTRRIDLAADAIAALRAQQARLLSDGHPRPWVFPNTEGGPGNRNHLLQRFKALCKDAEVPILKVHATRHAFASLAVKAGVDYKTIQKILGHYSVALTIDTYAHLAEDAQRSAAEKMDRFFAVGAR